MKRRSTTAAAVLVAVTALVAGLATAPANAADTPRHAVDAVPSWATPTADIGPLAASSSIDARVYLASRDPAGFQAFVDAVSDPDNALYQQYLSAADAAARFGPLPGASAQVSAWLTSVGLTVTDANQHFVGFRGTPATIGAAFGTAIDNFSVDGKTAFAPARAVSVPGELAADVLTVVGLSTQIVENRPMLVTDNDDDAAAAPAAGPEAVTVPCTEYEGQKLARKYPKAYGERQPFAVCGYEPKQLRGAYGVSEAGETGAGITMAVVDAYALPSMAKDLKKWALNRGEPVFEAGQYKEYVPDGTGYNPGWAGEEALDIEAIHAMAPDAKVVYVAARTPNDSSFFDAFQTIIDGDLADGVNNSWGGGTDQQTSPAIITEFENLFKMGAAEGIGFYFSSGDSGGQSGGQGVVQYPSIDPYVTSVGGSAIGIDRHDSYMWETSWETDYTNLSADGTSWNPAPPGVFASGAGGGTSRIFAQPKWQQGVVPKKFSEAYGSTPMRAVPDIGAVADPTTGFLEGYSAQVGGDWVYGENRIGGTSLSSPLIVGMQAVAEEAAGGTSFGFANKAIYKRYGSDSYNDVTDQPLGPGHRFAHVRTRVVGAETLKSLATAGNAEDAGLKSIEGWDTTTGVGSPTAAYFDR
jgi:subtilase family serine protease